MSDAYAAIRAIPLRDVLSMLGYSGWKKRSGKQEWYGKCVFHDPKKNKTSFSFDERRFNCFSCGESGAGAIDLVMKLKKIGFQEATKFLGASSSQENPAPITSKNNQEPVVLENKPFAGTYEKFYVKSEWLKKRGLTEESLKLYGVGEYRNPSRKSVYTGKILFRIPRFKDGACVGYLARTIDSASEDPKYIFPKGFHKQLEMFGAWQLRQKFGQSTRSGTSSGASASGLTLPLRVGFVVESPLCVMKYWQLGLYAVSPFGAFVSAQQVEIIRQLFRGVIYLPDRDKYDKIGPVVGELSKLLWVKAPELPIPVNDPEHLSPEQIAALVKS